MKAGEMNRRRGLPLPARASLLAAAAAMCLASVSAPVAAAAASPRAASVSPSMFEPVVPPRVAGALVRRPGTVIRRDGGFVVEQVRVPRQLRAPGVPGSVLRVTRPGRYAPRALPYVLTVDGVAVASATPSPNLRSVVALTDDEAVLTAMLGLTYGGRPASESSFSAVKAPSLVGPRRLPSPGPYEVARREYDLGDRAFQPTGLGAKVEIRADVHYPAGLPDGPYPIVLFMHGNHSSCYRGERAGYRWPCPGRWKPIPNYEGYDYAASRLASYGYVVVSVSANGVNVLGSRLVDTGMRQRGELLEEHLDLWQAWSTTGGEPFDDRFIGEVDMTTIGTMGHSRGGEGVVWHVIVDRERDDPYGIDAVMPIAPVDFTRETVNRVPLAVVLPYCDGDVFDLQGVHFFDDARYRVAGDTKPKHTLTLYGANHNFFNTVWTKGYPGSFDDTFGRCEGKLTPREQRRTGAAYIVSYFRRYLGGEADLDPIWTGAVTPAGVEPSRALMAYLAPDLPDRRLDVDRFTDERSIRRTEAGDDVTASGLSLLAWCANTVEVPCVPGDLSFSDVHLPGLSRGVFGWNGSDGEVWFDLGVGADVRAFDSVQFRASVNPGYRANDGTSYQNLSLSLVDGTGAEVTVAADDVGNEALRYPSGLRRYSGHVILQQVRFPLEGFDALDLSDVRAIVIRFDRTSKGVIDVADLNFSAGV
jgi:hypothetical protein